jgi:nitrite reductase/ring-hydroxylating ferredoxin subunit
MNARDRSASGGASRSRRDLLKAACGLATAGAVAACRRAAPVPDDVIARIPLASLPAGQRTVVQVQDRPVEFLRTAEGVSARSLKCTHLGCEVAWDERDRRYHCPCHEGVFDETGRVVAGPPPRPLRTHHVVVRGDEALVRS